MPCEVPVPPAIFRIRRFRAVVHEHGGEDPTTIIREDQSWAVNVRWRTRGLLNGWIDGQWHLHVFAESLGPGVERRLTDEPDHFIDLDPQPGSSNYFVHFDVAAGILPAGPAGITLYKIVTALTYVDASGNYGPMACHADGPIIQIYRPEGVPDPH